MKKFLALLLISLMICSVFASCSADDFDVDDHIAMWIEAKKNGTAGVPSTRELVHDAEDIQEMLNELAEALTADSKSTIAEIIAATRKEEQE